jgi:acyl-coenzyme A thioesterase PaaI-like protein
LHQGKRSHVVEIRIEDEHGHLVSTATLTNAILELSASDPTK